MGTCFSAAVTSTSNLIHQPTAKIVCVDGSLVEYSIPVCVSEVLGDSTAVFLCNSDSLYLDSYIPALSPDEFIELGQLYFLLPIDKFRHELYGSEMAALAVKACSALANVVENNKRSRGRSNARVLPAHASDVYGGKEYRRLPNEDSNSSWGHPIMLKSGPSWPEIVPRGIKLTAIEEVPE